MAATDFLRKRFMPHIWCPGCGHGIIMRALLTAIEKLDIEKNDIVMASGIGCSARMLGYIDVHTMHTLHGRALAFATGVKMARPDLTVVVPMGDGDALAIGGNHFIHAARRNIDMTAIVMNNSTYGMTGGQYSPTTGCGEYGTTAPYGTVVQPFDTVELATAAGASFIARTTTYHAREMARILADAIRHPGFSVVEVLTQCPTYYGRKNEKGDAVEMMERFRDCAVPVGPLDDNGRATAADVEAADASVETIPIGVFRKEVRAEYCDAYRRQVIEPAVAAASAAADAAGGDR